MTYIRPSWEIIASFSEIVKSYWAQWDSLCVCEGVLYRLWENSAGNYITKQLVLPKSLCATINFTSASLLANITIRPWEKLIKRKILYTG